MHEDYVSFEQAKVLKELGFDWECNHWYHPLEPDKIIECQTYCNHNSFERPYSAPTLAQAQKWLREVKGITILVNISTNKETYITKKVFYFKWFNGEFIFCGVPKYHYATYEEALSAGIDKMLEILKEK